MEPTHPREAALERFFRKYIRDVGGIAIKLAPTIKGVPDRLVVLPGGRMFFVELKTDVGQLSPAQEVIHQRLRQMGAPVVTLYGLAQIKEWVRRESWSPPERKPGRPRKTTAQAGKGKQVGTDANATQADAGEDREDEPTA